MLIDGLIKFCDEKSKNIKLKAEPQVFIEIKQALEELKALVEAKGDGWIACSERLPKEYDIVLLCTKDNMVSQGRRFDYFGHNRYELDGKFFILWDNDIIAWQPLPAPYRKR